MSFLIPSERLYESDTLIAFHHPRPSYALHILLLPKKEIRSLDEFDPTENQQFLISLFEAIRELARDFQLQGEGYRLVTNGGKYQDIPYLHFHLISDSGAD
jgi:histidine triad (HIT) family protein